MNVLERLIVEGRLFKDEVPIHADDLRAINATNAGQGSGDVLEIQTGCEVGTYIHWPSQ